MGVIECEWFDTIIGFDELKELTFLRITDNDRFDFSTCGDATSLREVSFLGCKGFDDLLDIKGLKKLEILDISETTVRDLQSLIEFPLLQQLSIIWCHWITDLSPIYKHPSLSSLGVIPEHEDDTFQKEVEKLRIAKPDLTLGDGGVGFSMEYWHLL